MTEETQSPDNTGETQAPEGPRDDSGRFRKGFSGNPAGMPKGTRHKATRAAEELLDGETDNLTRAVIAKAMEGDTTAMRLCLERILPPRKDRPVSFDLPPINTVQDAGQASSALMEAVASGDITPTEATEISKLIDTHLKVLELTEFDARLRKLEEAAAK